MVLYSFSVTNYRSITTAHKILVDNYTVLIGKNNEGKSNILKALNLAMTLLTQYTELFRPGRRMMLRRLYDWVVDFPIQNQNRKSGLQSVFRLQFKLNDTEREEFHELTDSWINGDLEVELKIGKENTPEITIPKRGKGATSLTGKSDIISKFISNYIYFRYIPTIRTEEQIVSTILEILDGELRSIEQNDEYIAATNTITDLQQKTLDSIADNIKGPLQEFVPSIKNISIELTNNRRRMLTRRDCEVTIDDGTATSIEYKGDGVKSLVAIAILRNRIPSQKSTVIAIEEPESHLHPAAMHQLYDTIYGMSENNQVIISTHNPLFVARDVLKSNIIVDTGNAHPAKNIKEIREVLGVLASDNLINSSYVLVVEGEDDKIALKKILPALSDKIENAMRSNILTIEEIGGAGNLSYKLNSLRNMLCKYHVLLDKDSAGQQAYEAAEKDGLTSIKTTTFTNCNGMRESEFEDCFDLSSYRDKIYDVYGVDLGVTSFKGNQKWSDRMRTTFMDQGKPWNDRLEKEIKYLVAESVDVNSLNQHKSNFITSTVQALETLLIL